MPRPKKWPPTILFHRRSGNARIRVRGKDYWLGKYGSAEAKKEYARLLVELADFEERQPLAVSAKLTLPEVLRRFLDHAEKNYSKSGGQTVRFATALQVVLEVCGPLEAARFGSAELRQVQQAMAGKGWCAAVVNRHIIRVRTAWRWLEEEGRLVPPGSWSALRVVRPLQANHPLYRPAPERRRSTDMESVRAVCRYLSAPVRALLLLQYWTGARTGELRSLRKQEVATTGETWILRPRQHKNAWRGQARQIVVGPRARAVLAPWLAACTLPEDYVFPPTPSRHAVRSGRRQDFPLAAYDRTRCYSFGSQAQAIRRAAAAAGQVGFFAYLCRHATRMRVSREHGDEQARAVLGQKHLDTTLRYGEIDQQLAEDVQKKLG